MKQLLLGRKSVQGARKSCTQANKPQPARTYAYTRTCPTHVPTNRPKWRSEGLSRTPQTHAASTASAPERTRHKHRALAPHCLWVGDRGLQGRSHAPRGVTHEVPHNARARTHCKYRGNRRVCHHATSLGAKHDQRLLPLHTRVTLATGRGTLTQYWGTAAAHARHTAHGREGDPATVKTSSH